MPIDELITQLQQRRATLTTELNTLLQVPTEANRDLNETEAARFAEIDTEIRANDARVAELTERRDLDARAAETARAYRPLPGLQVTEQSEYRSGPTGRSWFLDRMNARLGDRDAHDRLIRNNRQVADQRRQQGRPETRAGLTTVDGSGGELVPPVWLEDQFVAFARPGRVLANQIPTMDMVPGTDSINTPKVLTGTAVATMSGQNTAIQETDLTTTSISASVETIAGGQTISMQLIEQSPLNIDDLVLQDLAADYAMKIDTKAASGSGSSGDPIGLLTLSGSNAVAWTQSTPSVGGAGGFYSALGNAISKVHTGRFLPPDRIVMRPERWAWIEAASDANNRPLVVPQGQGSALNVAGVGAEHPVAEGLVGYMLGLPVFADANLPNNLGAGTNQDPIIVARFADLQMWEDEIRLEAFQQTYAQNLALFVRAYNYWALQVGRYAKSISIITGTGAVTPAF